METKIKTFEQSKKDLKTLKNIVELSDNNLNDNEVDNVIWEKTNYPNADFSEVLHDLTDYFFE